MISIKINNLEFLVKSNVSILEACKLLGYTIPRFCYHESLSISGNCRMCLVEVEGSEKPVASCVTDIEDGMSIWLNTIFVKKARENVLEILLINHPLDCPICDQAGECDLQDQTKIFGGDYSRMFKIKTSVEDKNCGPLIKTIMTRCIHCTRCIRFGDEVAGLSFLGTLNRGVVPKLALICQKYLNLKFPAML
jgi:NADH dehydrogenase/NADH:ubiquinone oxidoreductase subunit G